jgi:aryl-alcohol dehydrogenase-like predicted oxidoreductase
MAERREHRAEEIAALRFGLDVGMTLIDCEASLRRLETDRIDLYLLHWRGATPLDETLEGFNPLRRAGKIRHWGVSGHGDRLSMAISH